MNFSAPDLSQHPPRSPRVRLGGYVILARCLDKCRAEIAGTGGEYHYACPLDQRFLDFVGVDADALKGEVQKGLGDGDILKWINENARSKRSPVEVFQWSALAEMSVPQDVETREFFNGLQKAAAPAREDIAGWFDMLDVDDFVTFGGKA